MSRSNVDWPDVFSFVENLSIMTRVLLVTCIHNHPTSPRQRGMLPEHSDFVLMGRLSMGCLSTCTLGKGFYTMGLDLGSDTIQRWLDAVLA